MPNPCMCLCSLARLSERDMHVGGAGIRLHVQTLTLKLVLNHNTQVRDGESDGK
jgi:hypothetical protein